MGNLRGVRDRQARWETSKEAWRRFYRTELTPVSFLRRSAYMFPDKTAVIHGDRRYTYREFEERVNRLASRLKEASFQKGDRIAFLSSNIPPLLEARFKAPAAVEFGELPKTATGKVQTFQLREKEWEGQERRVG
jgi:acyl-CoA synthetase (AMP-forming)/AMP-acid ligase II